MLILEPVKMIFKSKTSLKWIQTINLQEEDS